jgi:glutamate--cysteine ligase
VEALAGHRHGDRLDEAALLADLASWAFAPTAGSPKVGLEVEMLVARASAAASLADTLAAIQPLIELDELADATLPNAPSCYQYGQMCLTFEPGGQIEVISPPRTALADTLEDIAKLELLLDRLLHWHDLRRVNLGINPWQEAASIPLQTPLPRYEAMQEYFARVGPEGLRMMRTCCALQINVDNGTGDQVNRRWELANRMAPILAGMFANSPLAAGRWSGWKSERARVWRGVDPTRSGAILAPDGPSGYLQFALDASVMLRRTSKGYITGTPGVRFRDWNDETGVDGPTMDDWRYHLTTLFPQVRPRGFLELRAIDTPPVRWRAVPVAVASTLLVDDEACEQGIELLRPYEDEHDQLVLAAARNGVAHPTVGSLARALMKLAREAISRQPEAWCSARIAADVEAYEHLYTACGRCPADDVLSQTTLSLSA